LFLWINSMPNMSNFDKIPISPWTIIPVSCPCLFHFGVSDHAYLFNHEQVTCKIHTQLKKHQHIRFMYFNPSKTVVTVCTIYYNIKNLYILPTECVHTFKMILTIKSNYFLKCGYVCVVFVIETMQSAFRYLLPESCTSNG